MQYAYEVKWFYSPIKCNVTYWTRKWNESETWIVISSFIVFSGGRADLAMPAAHECGTVARWCSRPSPKKQVPAPRTLSSQCPLFPFQDFLFRASSLPATVGMPTLQQQFLLNAMWLCWWAFWQFYHFVISII